MEYKKVKKDFINKLFKEGYTSVSSNHRKDGILEKNNIEENYYYIVDLYKSNFGNEVFLYFKVFFSNIPVEKEYRDLPLFYSKQYIYNLDNFTDVDINNMISDVKKYDNLFKTFEIFKKSIENNKKILDECTELLVSYLGYKRITLFNTFCIYKRLS